MPFEETGTQELLERVLPTGRLELTTEHPRGRARGLDRPHDRHADLLAHRGRHLRHPQRRRRPDAAAAPRPDADPALDRRPRHHRVAGGLHRAAPRLRRRHRVLRRARARAHRGQPLPRGDLDAAVHHRRHRPALRRARGRAVPGVRRRDRADDAGAGRAREDLDQHPALRRVRDPEPADDERRAVRRERVRRDRADQPRLPARRHEGAGAHRRHLPAQGLHLLRGALERARHAARRLARARVDAAVPRRGAQDAPGRIAARREDRRARPHLQARHRRHARLAVREADPPARARARARRATRPVRGVRPARGRRSPAPRRSSSRRTTRRSTTSPSDCPRTCCSSTRGTPPAPARCSAGPGYPSRRDPSPRNGRRRHDRHRRRAAADRATPTGRSSSPTSASRRSGCARRARSTPATCATPAEALAGAGRLHARHPPRGDRRRHRQLPQVPAHAARDEHGALQRRVPRGARARASSGSPTCRRRWCSRTRSEFPTPEAYITRHADPDVGVRLLEAGRRVLLPRAARRARAASTRSAGRSTRTGRARCPRTSRASPTWFPT